MRTRLILRSTLLLLIGFLPVEAGGLRTQLGEVVIQNLQIGRTYSLSELANLNLRVTNTSEYSAELRMDVLIPGKAELRHQAEPIPDPSWVALSCDSFSLGANREAVSEITISIPDEDRCLGKRYQFMVWSHTVPGSDGGMFLATGLKSRIIFTTDTVRADYSSGYDKPTGNGAFTVSPGEVHVNGAQENAGAALMIENPSTEVLHLRLVSRKVAGSLASIEPGWEDTPDPDYLRLEKGEITVPPKSERTVGLILQIPDEAALRGKRLMFLVHVYDETGEVITGVYVRVFATIEQ